MTCIYCGRRSARILSIREIFSFCGIDSNELCLSCQEKFTPLKNQSCCVGCARESKDRYCRDCCLWQSKYPGYSFQHSALFHYDQEMKAWFEEYKFRGNYQLRQSFSSHIRKALRKKSDYLILPIPLSEERLKERGFNQVEGLLSGAGIKYRNGLQRIKNDLPQSKKTREARLAGSQPFCLSPKFELLVRDRKVLLVDDIYTTGRTLFFASEILLKYPVKKLQTFSLAR